MKDQPGTGPATQHGTDAAPMIELADAELHLASAGGNVNILRGIDLSIAAGETIGVIGPSGSGKSTMMMVIAGLERLTGGKVAVAGRDLAALDEDALGPVPISIPASAADPALRLSSPLSETTSARTSMPLPDFKSSTDFMSLM